MFTRQKKLAHIKLSKSLSPYNTRKFLNYLRDIRPKNYDAIAISIQAGAGDFVQTKIAMEALDELSKKQIMPIYTFAEDFAIDTGYLLLCCGNEVRANPFSIVGDIGRSVKLVAVQQLLKKLGVQHYAYSSNSKYSHPYNHYKKHDKLESDFLEKMVLSQKEEFSKKFMQKRGLSVEAAQLKPAQIKDILEGGFYIADDALKLGMVDKIQTFEDFKEENFPNHKLEEVKLDNEDDFDFDVLELTTGPTLQILNALRADPNFGLGSSVSSDGQTLRIPGQREIQTYSQLLDILDERDFEIIADKMSDSILRFSINQH